MAGLCYRNGYGVERDEERGMKLLRRASLLGYQDAEEEMNKAVPENSLYDDGVIDNSRMDVPDIDTSLNDISLLAGSYQGVLVQYDWSGQHVISERPIAMTIVNQSTSAEGFLCIDNDTVSFTAGVTADGCLEFCNSTLIMPERYTGPHGINYRMDRARLNIWQNRIYGRLDLYSLKLKEPERPMYIEMTRCNTSLDLLNDSDEKILTTPNPFNEYIKASFTISKDVSNVQARFFNHAGVLKDVVNLGDLTAGKHTVDIYPALSDGYYVLNVQVGDEMLRTIVIKKGMK